MAEHRGVLVKVPVWLLTDATQSESAEGVTKRSAGWKRRSTRVTVALKRVAWRGRMNGDAGHACTSDGGMSTFAKVLRTLSADLDSAGRAGPMMHLQR